jgi:2-amino-4-hydroxy-6-hydroxymethyldihydropteridine diphosphokinase
VKRRAYIALGANQGDPLDTLQAAVEALKSVERSTFVAVSPFYKTAPIEAEGPDFVNAVVALDTEIEPYALLLHLLDIEIMLGRKRRGGGDKRHPARKVDLDLVLVDQLMIQSTPLTLPHPRMHQRAFVLFPLVDLDPAVVIPGRGPAADLLPLVADQRVERIAAAA